MINLTKAEPFPIGQDRTLLLSLVSVDAATGLLSWLNPFYRGRFKKRSASVMTVSCSLMLPAKCTTPSRGIVSARSTPNHH
jgi:hypothetical protein